MHIWDIADRDHPIPPATAIAGNTAAFAFPGISPDGKTLAVGGQDQTIRLRDITDPLHATPIGSPLRSHKGGAQVAFSPDGKTLASGGDDGSVLVWGIADRDHPVTIGDSLIPPGVASRTRIAFDSHGRLYAVSRDSAIRIWNLAHHSMVTAFAVFIEAVEHAAVDDGVESVGVAVEFGGVRYRNCTLTPASLARRSAVIRAVPHPISRMSPCTKLWVCHATMVS